MSDDFYAVYAKRTRHKVGPVLALYVALAMALPAIFLTWAMVKTGDTGNLGAVVIFTLIFTLFVILGVTSWRGHPQRRPVITADALGLWVGARGRRVPWADIAEISIIETVAGIDDRKALFTLRQKRTRGDHAGAALQGLLQRRLLDSHVAFDLGMAGSADVIAGVTAMARLAGHRLKRQSDTQYKVWTVVPMAGAEASQGFRARVAEDPPRG